MRFLFASLWLASSTLHAQSSGKGCIASDLSLGTPVTASLDASDCKLSDITATSNAASAKAYRLTLSERQTVSIEMTSQAFNTYLVLMPDDRDGQYGANDDSPDLGTDSRIVANLAPGSYRILASAAAPSGAGQFQLKAVPEAGRKCEARDLPVGETLEGALSAASCRELDISEVQAGLDPSAVNVYRAVLESAGILTLEIKGGARPPEVRVEGGRLPVEPFRSRSKVSVNLPAGSYRVAVSSNLYLSYSLSTSFEPARACAVGTLAAGAKVSGALSEEDCRFQDFMRFAQDPSYVDAYRIEVAERGLMKLRMDSGSIDPFLVLVDDRGRVLAANDDASEETFGSEIFVHLVPGTYTLLANTMFVEMGGYELQASFEPARGCVARELPAQGTAETTLGADAACRLLDVEQFGYSPRGVVPYRFDAKAGVTRLDLSAFGGATGYDVIDSTGRLLARARTDRFGQASSEIQLRPGQHRVLLYAEDDGPVSATLRVSTSAAKACPPGELGLGGRTASRLSASDCRVLDAMLESASTEASKAFRLTVPSSGRLDLDLFSGEFEPMLLLLDQNDKVLESASRRAPSAMRLSARVTAGSYRVVVASQSSLGTFDLSASFEEGADAPAPNPRNEPLPKPQLKRQFDFEP